MCFHLCLKLLFAVGGTRAEPRVPGGARCASASGCWSSGSRSVILRELMLYHVPTLDRGGMLVYNFRNPGRLFCTYFLVTDSGKENLITNVKPSLNPRSLQRIFRSHQERRGTPALWVVSSDRGGRARPALGRPQATERTWPRPGEERLGFVLHSL